MDPDKNMYIQVRIPFNAHSKAQRKDSNNRTCCKNTEHAALQSEICVRANAILCNSESVNVDMIENRETEPIQKKERIQHQRKTKKAHFAPSVHPERVARITRCIYGCLYAKRDTSMCNGYLAPDKDD
jgi:hypothetical protein